MVLIEHFFALILPRKVYSVYNINIIVEEICSVVFACDVVGFRAIISMMGVTEG